MVDTVSEPTVCAKNMLPFSRFVSRTPWFTNKSISTSEIRSSLEVLDDRTDKPFSIYSNDDMFFLIRPNQPVKIQLKLTISKFGCTNADPDSLDGMSPSIPPE